ncbi:MAG: bifunctional chorismate mutase/prephenate dehydratase, partial [Chloroflexi bacterium]
MAHGGVPLTAIAYQGLAGAFSEAAAAALFPGASLLPRRTFAEVFAALDAHEANAAVVPVENTHAGSVADVYDLLRQHNGAKVVAEAIVRVRHCLLGVPGSRLGDIRVARSHPQALAQCEDFLRRHDIRPEVAFDTAGAAAEVADAKDPAVAAVASRRAAERYGLEVLADSIETSNDNFTRFFAVAPEAEREVATLIPAALRKGPTKTSLVYKTANLPGALVRSLQPFATAWIQLSKIESRPSRAAPWDYVFYLDFEGDPTAW